MLPGFKPNRVNETIKMECAKVVDSVDIEDMGDKGVFCRYSLISNYNTTTLLVSIGAGSLRSFLTVTGPMPSTTLRRAIMWDLLLSRSQVNHQS